MVTYTPIVQHLPSDLQVTLLQLVEAVEQNLREQLPPREEVIDIRAMSNGLIEMQLATQQRMDRLESILQQIAETQQRTEVRIGQLTEAQQRTEVGMEQLTQVQQHTEARLGQLAEAQQHTEHQLTQLTSSVTELTNSVRTMRPRIANADGQLLEQRYAVLRNGSSKGWEQALAAA